MTEREEHIDGLVCLYKQRHSIHYKWQKRKRKAVGGGVKHCRHAVCGAKNSLPLLPAQAVWRATDRDNLLPDNDLRTARCLPGSLCGHVAGPRGDFCRRELPLQITSRIALPIGSRSSLLQSPIRSSLYDMAHSIRSGTCDSTHPSARKADLQKRRLVRRTRNQRRDSPPTRKLRKRQEDSPPTIGPICNLKSEIRNSFPMHRHSLLFARPQPDGGHEGLGRARAEVENRKARGAQFPGPLNLPDDAVGRQGHP